MVSWNCLPVIRLSLVLVSCIVEGMVVTHLAVLAVNLHLLLLLLLFLRAGVQPTLDPYAEAFFVAGPLH